jgi:hypothetical protein
LQLTKGHDMSNQNSAKLNKEVIDEIIKSLEAIRFGSVEITVHDGRITQIERSEKVRFQDITQKETKPTVKAVARNF